MLNCESRRLYSWWWDSHISPKNSKWLQENLTDMDSKVKSMIKLIEEDADSFTRRAEMYYKKRPELMKLVEEFYRAYHALAERYDYATGELRHAQKTLQAAFPDQEPFTLPEDSSSSTDRNDQKTDSFNLQLLLEAKLKNTREKDVCEIEKLKKAVANLIAEKDELFVKYQCSLQKLSNTDEELNHAVEKSRILEERQSEAEEEVHTLKETLRLLQAEKESGLNKQMQHLETISDLVEKVNGMDTRGVESLPEIWALIDKLARLESENDAGLLRYGKCLEKISGLEKKIIETEEKVKMFSEQKVKAEMEVVTLKNALLELTEEKEAIRVLYSECLEKSYKLEYVLSSAQSDVQRLTNDIINSTKKLKNVEEICIRLEKSNESLKLEASDLANKIMLKDRELPDKHDELEKLQTYAKDEHKHYVQVEATLEALKMLYTRSQDEQRNLATELKNGLQMVTDLEICKSGLEQEMKQIKDDNEKLKKSEVELTGLKQLKEKLEEEVALQLGQSTAMQNEISNLKDEISELNTSYSSLMSQLESVGLNPESFALSIKCLQDENSRLKTVVEQNNDLESACESLHVEKSGLVIENSVLLSQLNVITVNMQKLVDQNTVLEDSSSSTDRNDQKTDSFNLQLLLEAKLKNTREKDVCEIEKLKKAVADLIAEKDELFVKYQCSLQKLSNTDEELNHAVEKSRILEERQSEAEEEVHTLKETLRLLQAEKESGLNKQMQHLETISDLVEKVNGMDTRGVESLPEIWALIDKLARLESENDAGLLRYGKCLEKISGLEKKIIETEEKVKMFSEQKVKAEMEVVTLKNALLELTEEKEAIRVLYSECLEKSYKLEYVLSSAQSDVQRLTNDIINSTKKLKNVEEICIRLEKSNESLKLEASDLANKIMLKDRELPDKHDELEKLQTYAKDEHKHYVQVEATLEALKMLYTRSQDEQRNLATELKNGLQMVTDLEICKSGLEQEMKQIKDDNEKLKKSEVELTGLKQLKEKLEEEVALQLGQSTAMQNEISNLKDEISELNTSYSSLMSQLESVGLNPESFALSIKCLQDENSRLKTVVEQNNDLESACESLHVEKSGLVIENSVLLSQLNVITVNMQKLVDQNTVLEDSSSSTDRNDQKTDSFNLQLLLEAKLKNTREKDVCEIEKLKKAVADLIAEKDELFVKYQCSLQKLSNTDEELNHAVEKSRILEERQSEAEEEVHTLKETLRLLQAEKESGLNKQMQHLETISDLVEKVNGMDTRGVESLPEIWALIDKLARLESENDAGLLRYGKCLEKISGLEKKIIETEEKVKMFSEQKVKAEMEVVTLKNALLELTEEKEAIRVLYSECLEKSYKLEYVLSSAQSDVQRLTNDIINSTKKLKNVEEICIRLEKSNESLKLEASDLANKIMLKDRELPDKHDELEKLQTYAKDEHKHYVQVEATLEALKMLYTRSQDEQRNLATELKNGLQMVTDLEICKSGLEQEMKQIKDDNEKLKKSEVELTGLKQLKEKLEEEVALQLGQSTAMQNEISNLKDEISELNTSYSSLMSQLESVGLNPESFALSIKCLQDENSRLKTVVEQNNDLESACESLHVEKSGLVIENSVLLSQLNVITVNMQKLVDQNTVLEDSSSSTDRNDQKTDSFNLQLLLEAKLKNTREKDVCEIEKLKKAVADLIAEKDELFVKYQCSLQKLSNTDEELNHAVEKSRILEERQSEAEEEVHTLKETLRLLQAEKESGLNKQMQHLETISDLVEKVNGMDTRGVESLPEIWALIDKLARLESENDAGLLRYGKCLEKISGLEKKIIETEEKVKMFSEQKVKAEMEVVTLKNALLELTEEKEAIRVLYSECLEKSYKLEYVLSSAQSDVQRLTNDIINSTKKLKNVEEICIRLEKSNESLKLEASDLANKIMLKDRELPDKHDELEKLQTYAKDEHKHYVQVEATLEALKMLYTRSQDEQRNLATELKNGLQMVTDLEICKSGLEQEMKQIKDDNEKLKKSEVELTGLKQLKEKLEEEVALQLGQSTAMQNEISNLKDEISELNTSYSSLMSQLESVGLNPESFALSIKCLQDENSRLKTVVEQNNDLESACESLHVEKSGLVIENSVLLSQLNVITVNMQKLVDQNTVLEDSSSSTDRNDQKTDSFNLQLLLEAKLKNTREKDVCEIEKLKKAVADLIAEKDELFVKYQCSLQKLSNTDEELNHAVEKSRILEERQSEAEEEVHTLKETLRLLQAEKESGLNKQMQHLETISDLVEKVNGMDTRGVESLPEIWALIDKLARLESENDAGLLRYGKCLEKISGLEKKIIETEEKVKMFSEQKVKAEMEVVTLKNALLELTEEKEATKGDRSVVKV